ncbi:MAG: flagellar basal body protein [Betaproteobacteria bacterium]
MTQSIEALTTNSLSLALDAASMRQQVIAANIANANVAGYTAKTVTFDAVMASAFGGPHGASSATLDAHVVPRLDADGRASAVQIDSEMAELSMNQLQYQTLIAGLNKHLSVLSVAIADGKS